MQLQPLKLQTLSLEVLVNHIINLLKAVNRHSATIICEIIKDLIHKEVSHVFADVVTKKLLERICRLHHCYILHRLKKALLKAIIHPKVTQLHLNFHDFYSINSEEDGDNANSDIVVYTWNNIINRLESLNKLYISDKNNSYIPRIIPNHIVAMDVDHCDNLLTVIADSCPALKELHVRDFKATSVSIQSLQRLLVLEKLNIVNTACHLRCYGIDIAEFHHFITHLSTRLKTLSCSEVKVSDINHLAKPQLYTHFTSLTVFGLRIDAPFSLDFVSLKELHLWGVEIYHSPILTAIGHQLTTLSLHVCVIGNLSRLARQCPSLENLSLKRVRYFGPNEHTEAEFTSLRTVHLECNHFCSWCLLIKSVKLNSMTLCYYTRDEENSCQNRCLRINQFPELQVFNACNSMADEALPGLLNVCSTIKAVKGVKTSSLIEDIRMVYPWVRFCC